MVLLVDKPTTDQDTALVSRSKRGDMTAFDSLFAAHKDGVYSLVARKLGRDPTDDVCQEVFLQVFRSLGNFRGESSLRTWLYRITQNVCCEHLRQDSRQPQTSSISEIDDVPDENLDRQDETTEWTLSEVEQAIGRLAETEQTAMELHYIQGLTYQEMSVALGAPVGTVKARTHSAIARIRHDLRHLAQEADEL